MALSPFSSGAYWSGISTPSFCGGGGLRTSSGGGCSFIDSRTRFGLGIFARARVKASSTSQEAEDKTQDAGTSFLRMWERAKQRRDDNDSERSSSTSSIADDAGAEDWVRRDRAFMEILQVPSEERDKAQRRQIVDRAAAAIAAANAFLAQNPVIPPKLSAPSWEANGTSKPGSGSKVVPVSVREVRPLELSRLKSDATRGLTPGKNSTFEGIPGPDFWSWVPEPLEAESRPSLKSSKPKGSDLVPKLSPKKQNVSSAFPWEDYEERVAENLPLIFQSRAAPSLPPFQSLLKIEKEELKGTEQESVVAPQPDLRMPEPDTQIASAVNEKQRNRESSATRGRNEDGSRWWQESGVEYRDNGVVCNWTVIRGVSAEGGTEWEEKFWEASDAFDYKELGAEKSGRDASGRVWREFWKEAMWQDLSNGLQHVEKTADKWAHDGKGGQWHEKWYEHYDASGRADKWADKWSEIDPNTPLEPGHAHSWHERWGETYDGHGGTMKYTDKWAEKQEEGGGWTKWGDKWDEHFDQHGQGVKQGETWWQGTSGERWNRTWGERHNRTGWVHKYGKSSSGEHWDTHEQQDTWYEGKPHFGFRECVENSVVLQRVGERKRPQL